MAYEQLGLQIDSAHIVDGIEISDELRGIYALLKNATGEFKAACIAFDDAVNVHKVLSATPQKSSRATEPRRLARARRADAHCAGEEAQMPNP
jgi:hypothetical protein